MLKMQSYVVSVLDNRKEVVVSIMKVLITDREIF